MKRILGTTIALVVLAGSAALAFAAAGGVSNGGFESGSLAPWTAINAGAGQWAVDDGSLSGGRCAGFSGFPGPYSGSFDALYNQSFPTSGVLYQDVVVPAAATTLTLVAEWLNEDGLWTITPGDEFDFARDNQWISVDVLKAGTNPKSFDPGKIVATLLRHTSGTSALSSPWQTYSADLSDWVGQTVRLRVAATDGNDCLPFAVDNVAFRNTAVQDERIAYCSVAGDTWPDGTAIPAGTFLNLEAGQPATEAAYAGAVPANYVAGVGLTCDPPPAGDTQQGYAGAAQHVAEGVYPYYSTTS